MSFNVIVKWLIAIIRIHTNVWEKITVQLINKLHTHMNNFKNKTPPK